MSIMAMSGKITSGHSMQSFQSILDSRREERERNKDEGEENEEEEEEREEEKEGKAERVTPTCKTTAINSMADSGLSQLLHVYDICDPIIPIQFYLTIHQCSITTFIPITARS